MLRESKTFEYFDLSPEISEAIAVWPGDQPFTRQTLVDFKRGGGFFLSSIQTSVHLGAHVDAPNHYHPQGQGIETRSLDFYLGACQVIHVSLPRSCRILPSHLENREIKAPRVLFRTESFPNPNQWNPDFCSLSPELVDFLAKQGVKLIGIDTPSVDLFDDKELLSHQAIYRNHLAVLEGIVLNHVPEGVYQLVALPLRIKGADASPVRAILIQQNLPPMPPSAPKGT